MNLFRLFAMAVAVTLLGANTSPSLRTPARSVASESRPEDDDFATVNEDADLSGQKTVSGLLACADAVDKQAQFDRSGYWHKLDGDSKTFAIWCQPQDAYFGSKTRTYIFANQTGLKRVVFPVISREMPSSAGGNNLVLLPRSVIPFSYNDQTYYIGDGVRMDFTLISNDAEFAAYARPHLDSSVAQGKANFVDKYRKFVSPDIALLPLPSTAENLSYAYACIENHINFAAGRWISGQLPSMPDSNTINSDKYRFANNRRAPDMQNRYGMTAEQVKNAVYQGMQNAFPACRDFFDSESFSYKYNAVFAPRVPEYTKAHQYFSAH